MITRRGVLGAVVAAVALRPLGVFALEAAAAPPLPKPEWMTVEGSVYGQQQTWLDVLRAECEAKRKIMAPTRFLYAKFPPGTLRA